MTKSRAALSNGAGVSVVWAEVTREKATRSPAISQRGMVESCVACDGLASHSPVMFLERIYDESLAQAAYLVACDHTKLAVIVDANRDVEPCLRAAEHHGFEIIAVTETHIHADFVSGSRELARRTGARLLLSCEGGPGWQYGFAT